jgi:hypothetical protein
MDLKPTASEAEIETLEEAIAYISKVIDNFTASISTGKTSPSTAVMLKGH